MHLGVSWGVDYFRNTVEPVLSGPPRGKAKCSLKQVDRLIQVVQNTGQNTVKMPFCITVNDAVYSLCIKVLKNSGNCNNNMV